MGIWAEIETQDGGSEAINNLSVEEIEDEIRKLDGIRYAIIIKNTDVSWESFSVVKKGLHYLCFYYSDNEYYLVNPLIDTNDEWEVDMPHPTVRPAKYFNTLNHVLIAAKTYIETKQLDATLIWEVW